MSQYRPSDLKIPGLNRESISALDAAFPERCPDITDSERAVWIYAGKRELVRYLKQQLEVSEHVMRVAGLPL